MGRRICGSMQINTGPKEDGTWRMVSGVAPARSSAFRTRMRASSRCSSAFWIAASAGCPVESTEERSPYTDCDRASHGACIIAGSSRFLPLPQGWQPGPRFVSPHCRCSGLGGPGESVSKVPRSYRRQRNSCTGDPQGLLPLKLEEDLEIVLKVSLNALT